MLPELKSAIYQNLSEFYDDTYHLEFETDLHNNPVDTMEVLCLLRIFSLTSIVHLTRGDYDLLSNQLDEMEKLCNQGLDLLGHRVGFNSTTGPYSVRLQTIDRIRAMLSFTLPCDMPTYNKPCYQFIMPYGNNDKVKVSCYRIEFTQYHVVFYLKPSLFTLSGEICTHVSFDDSLSYDKLSKGDKPYFMTYFEYERI